MITFPVVGDGAGELVVEVFGGVGDRLGGVAEIWRSCVVLDPQPAVEMIIMNNKLIFKADFHMLFPFVSLIARLFTGAAIER